jgi:peptide/nickel transport system substrate-binding protein
MHTGLRGLGFGAAALLAALMVSPHAGADGGTLRYATIGEPPALDVQMTTATIAITIGEHIFETLYAFDAAYEPQPMLATGEKVEDGGRTLVISLRPGVMFHNGKEMTSEDVVASLKRWGEFGSRGKLLMANAKSLEATGKYEVTLKLSEPNGAWKSMLAYPEGGPVIYPAEIVGKAGNQPIAQKDYIGTGPYKFKEWRPNRYVELERFDGYKPRSEKADGYAGARKANFDTIRFIPVPDVGTRVSGVQAGDYDYAEFISGDLYDSLSKDPSVKIHRSGAPLFGLFFTNSKAGVFKDNFALRRAVQTALGKEAALRVSFGPEGLWKAQGSLFAEGNRWYSTAGIESYNPRDPAKAKEMAKAAGYDGKPIKLLVSTNYQTHYDQATVFTKQLAEAGINVQMMVVDWATLLKMRGEPEQWDMFVTHHSFVPDPILFTPLNDTYPGWWSSPEKEALKKEFIGTADPAARKAAWDKIQALFYEQVPAIKVGDAYSYDIASTKLQGMGAHTVLWPHFWNVSFK